MTERQPFTPIQGEDEPKNATVRAEAWNHLEEVRRLAIISQDFLELGIDEHATYSIRRLAENLKIAMSLLKKAGLNRSPV